jgi:hypothetical protein
MVYALWRGVFGAVVVGSAFASPHSFESREDAVYVFADTGNGQEEYWAYAERIFPYDVGPWLRETADRRELEAAILR